MSTEGLRKGADRVRANADEFAAKLLPLIREVQASGVTGPRAVNPLTHGAPGKSYAHAPTAQCRATNLRASSSCANQCARALPKSFSPVRNPG